MKLAGEVITIPIADGAMKTNGPVQWPKENGTVVIMSGDVYERVQKTSHQEPLHPIGKVTQTGLQQANDEQPAKEAKGRMQKTLASDPHRIFEVQGAEYFPPSLITGPP